MKDGLTLLGFILLLAHAASAQPDSADLHFADSIFELPASEQVTHARVLRDDHTYYLVTTCATVSVPFGEIVAVLKKFERYQDVFGGIRRSFVVDSANAGRGREALCLQMGAWLAVSWALGFGTCRFNADSTEYQHWFLGDPSLYALRREWDVDVDGFLRIRYHHVANGFRVRDLGDGTSRVAVIAVQAPAVPIPSWLYKGVMSRIFPAMVTDLVDACSSRTRGVH